MNKRFILNKKEFGNELNFKAVRSSGPGGQHANKVSTKIELTFNIKSSTVLNEIEKVRIGKKLASRITKDGLLILQCDESRSQHKNKEIVIKRFFEIIEKALKVPKPRKKTKPSKAAIEKRLKQKKIASEKKASRGKVDLN